MLLDWMKMIDFILLITIIFSIILYYLNKGLVKKIIVFFLKNIFKWSTWLYCNLKYLGNNTYKQTKFLEFAKIKLEDCEFKYYLNND